MIFIFMLWDQIARVCEFLLMPHCVSLAGFCVSSLIYTVGIDLVIAAGLVKGLFCQ